MTWNLQTRSAQLPHQITASLVGQELDTVGDEIIREVDAEGCEVDSGSCDVLVLSQVTHHGDSLNTRNILYVHAVCVAIINPDTEIIKKERKLNNIS